METTLIRGHHSTRLALPTVEQFKVFEIHWTGKMVFYRKSKTVGTENRWAVGRGWRCLQRGTQGFIRWRDYSVFISVVVTQLHTFIKTYQTVHFRIVNFSVCRLYLCFKNGFLCMNVIKTHYNLYFFDAHTDDSQADSTSSDQRLWRRYSPWKRNQSWGLLFSQQKSLCFVHGSS